MSTEIDVANCTDEEVLAELIAKTNDMNLRKQIRARQKELREKETAAAVERQKQREATGTNLDSVKTRAKQAEEERAKKMASYQEQAKQTIGAISSSDPVKAKHERAMKDKEVQMKQYDELAKSGGAAAYQGGLESVNQMELRHKEAEKARIMKQFDKMQEGYSKNP